MNRNDETLRELSRQLGRKKQLEARLRELYSQLDPLVEEVDELEAVKLTEQADVDRLEGGSLASFFYNVIGKMDEKLSKEKEEAYAARVKYDAAALELSALREEIERSEAELRTLLGCEERYEQALNEKIAAMKAAGGASAQEILALERRLTQLEQQKKELWEAIHAGNRAMASAEDVMNSLDSAEGWGTFDLLGGGLLADAVKHSHLDEAQQKIGQLQLALRRFKTELADVGSIRADVQVNIDGFLRFADYFFDNLFTDWAVMDQISRSKEQMNSTMSQIRQVLSRLESQTRSVESERAQTKARLDELVTKA